MSTGTQLNRSTPEKQGISSASILAFVQDVEQNIHEMHSFMLLRHGYVVAEGWWSPYAPQRPHMLFSLSKSFTSTAIGLAVAEGRLSVDDPVLSFFPKDTPAKVGPNLAAMRVRHLLSMSTGHHTDTMGRIQKRRGKNWARAFLSLPVEHEPGTYFLYNTGATYMLSAIIQKLTGMKLLDYLEPRLFAPLDIHGAAWETSPEGINMGGFGLSVKTEDIAQLGQLYLQKGVWNGARILPESWVAEATSYQVPNSNTQTNPDWTQGYGYQFWRCQHNAYRGDGAFGQYCIVMPDQDVVLAITSGVGDMQSVLTLIWEKLLPALGPSPLPEDHKAAAALSQKLKSLALLPPAGINTSPLAEKLSGKIFAMDANNLTVSAVTFNFSNNGDTLLIKDARGEHSLCGGKGAWQESITTLFPQGTAPIAASGVWTAEDTYALTVRVYETPFFYTMVCHFDGDTLMTTNEMNVGFGPNGSQTMTGHLVR